MNEAKVLLRCRSGDKDAFRLLVEEYGDLVRRTGYLMVRDRLLAEDLSQEAFLLAWRGIRSFRTEIGFKPWLMRILTNCIASHHRRRFPRVLPLESEEIVEDPPDPGPGPQVQAERAERGREMADALSTLPEEWSRVLILRYYAELSVPFVVVYQQVEPVNLAVALGDKKVGERFRLNSDLALGPYHFRVTEGEIVEQDGQKKLTLYLDLGDWDGNRKLMSAMPAMQLNGAESKVEFRGDEERDGQLEWGRIPLSDDVGDQVTLTFRGASVALRGPWRLQVPVGARK